MIKFLQEHSWAMYLGGSLTMVTGSIFDSWQWWAIVIPTAILIRLRR